MIAVRRHVRGSRRERAAALAVALVALMAALALRHSRGHSHATPGWTAEERRAWRALETRAHDLQPGRGRTAHVDAAPECNHGG